MTTLDRHRPLWPVLALAALLSATTAAAEDAPAETRTAVDTRAGRVLELTVCGKAGTFDLDIYAGMSTLLRVPDDIKNYSWDADSGIEFIHWGERLYVSPKKSVPAGTLKGARVWSKDKDFEFSMHLTVSDQLPPHTNVIIKQQLDRGEPARGNPCNPLVDDSLREARIRAFGRHETATDTVIGVPEVELVARSGEAVDASLPLAEWVDGHLTVDFDVENPWSQPARLVAIEAVDRDGQPIPSEVVYRGKDDGSDEIATLEMHGRIRGSLLIPNAIDHDIEPMQIKFIGTKGTAPYTTAIKVIRMRPVSEADEAREARARQMAVSVRGVYGGFWTDDGADLGMLAGTNVTGFGIRITKGFFHHIAFEADIIGGRTGQAQFADAQWQNMQGAIVRQANIGRLQGSGVLRFGHRHVVSMRLGVGVQAIDYESSFTAGGVSMPGPGGSFTIDGMYTVGVGFDSHIGKHWTFGAGANFSSTLQTISRTLDAGIRIGYRWNP